MRLSLFVTIMLVGCRNVPPAIEGLTAEDQDQLESLLKASTDAVFNQKLYQIRASGKLSSILVLTHAMFQLPWEKDLEPRGRNDLRMRKLRVEKALDELVSSTEHDQLSARYFRAVTGDGSAEKASDDLIRWTLVNNERFVWNPESQSFFLKP